MNFHASSMLLLCIQRAFWAARWWSTPIVEELLSCLTTDFVVLLAEAEVVRLVRLLILLALVAALLTLSPLSDPGLAGDWDDGGGGGSLPWIKRVVADDDEGGGLWAVDGGSGGRSGEEEQTGTWWWGSRTGDWLVDIVVTEADSEAAGECASGISRESPISILVLLWITTLTVWWGILDGKGFRPEPPTPPFRALKKVAPLLEILLVWALRREDLAVVVVVVVVEVV